MGGSALTGSAQYPDGWVGRLRLKGLLGTQTPDGSKIAITVERQGYSGGVLSTFTEVVSGLTGGLRLVHPNASTWLFSNDGADTFVYFAHNSRIHQGDTIVGVSVLAGSYGGASNAGSLSGASVINSSTRAYAKGKGKFVVPFDLVAEPGATTFTVEFTGEHWAARNGRPFESVTFTATDEHSNSVTATIDTLTLSSSITKNNTRDIYVQVYEWAVPLTTLTDGDIVTVKAEAKPWIGNSSGVLRSDLIANGGDGYAWPGTGCSVIANYRFLNNKANAYGTPYAYVDPVSGTSGGVVSATAATARATPFQTIAQAATAIQTFNNTNFGRSNVGNGRIRLMNTGSHVSFGASLFSLVAGKTWLYIEDDPLNVGDAIFTSAVGSASNTTSKLQCDALCVRGRIDFQAPDAVAGTQTMIYSGNVNGSNKRLLLDGIKNSVTGGNTFYGQQWRLARNIETTSGIGFGTEGVTQGNWIQVLGVYQPTVGGGALALARCLLGCYFNNTGWGIRLAGTGIETCDGGIQMFNVFLNQKSSSGIVGSIDFVRGFAADTFVLEGTHATSATPLMYVSGDGMANNVDEMDIWNAIVVGARTNWFYTDIDTIANKLKRGTVGSCMVDQDNRKTDSFIRVSDATVGTSAQRTGNWEIRHQVDCGPIIMFGPDYSGDGTAPAEGLGERMHPLSLVTQSASSAEATWAVQRAAVFVDPKAGVGGVGLGDYRHKAGVTTARSRVPAAMQRWTYDLAGVTRKTDGTGAAGPYEWTT
jgi:hypothetical protein